jgi:hypothetical protein
MNFIVNFYSCLDENYDSFEEIIQGIETDNIMYLTTQIGDIVVVPTLGECEYIVKKVVKKFYNKELDIYVSKVKSQDQLIDEANTSTNSTIIRMFDSVRDAKIFDFTSVINSNIISTIKNSKDKDMIMLK